MDKTYCQSPRLRLPAHCYQTIDSLHETFNLPFFQNIVIQTGVLHITLNYTDSSGQTLEKLSQLMGKIHTHDTQGRVLWDVICGGTNGNEQLAISHQDNEFLMHTDCSYEYNVPDYFGLQVIQPDKIGGGVNLLVDGHILVQQLSEKSLQVLQNEKVKIRVPTEFKKDTDAVNVAIIGKNFDIQYRGDLIERHLLSEEQHVALDEFESLCYSPTIARSIFLEKNTILIIDNKRFLHARTRIKDRSRHLKRVRFYENFHAIYTFHG